MAPLYPPLEPLTSGHLQVSSIHTLYYEECGSASGTPILFLHGGPGGGIRDRDRRYFDPTHYRTILHDQRGSGKSIPNSSSPATSRLTSNTTWDLVADIERLRQHLSISKWIVFGGSWGSALALAYAETHPERCGGIVLRGVCTLRKSELDWFNQGGAEMVFPERAERFWGALPVEERGDVVGAYYRRLVGGEPGERVELARAWCAWGNAASSLLPPVEDGDGAGEDSESLVACAQIETHFFVNRGWMRDGQLIEEAHKIKHLPIAIVQGRYDMLCPPKTSWDLYQALGGGENPNVDYKIIEGCGHSAGEKGTEEALVDAVDKFKSLIL